MITGKTITDYMLWKGYKVFTDPKCYNIVYVEGADYDLRPNADRPDEWNDRRLIIEKNEIIFNVTATTEPGRESTFSPGAGKLKGVARIAFGQYTAWRRGLHKGDPEHPALVQHGIIPCYRDLDKNFIRTGDKLWNNVTGLNQHGTRKGALVQRVGAFSAGCLVGHNWQDHETFIDICETDPRFITDRKFLFTTTIIAGDDLWKFYTKK